MTKLTTTVRTLDTLPLGISVDSDPAVIDGECIIPRGKDRKALAVRPSPDCLSCRGQGLIGEYVTMPGEKPVRQERPCSCCWSAVSKFEYTEARGAQGAVTGASFQRADTALDRAKRRVDRLRAEVGAAGQEIANIEAARRAKIAPFETALADAETAAASAVEHAASSHAMVERTRAAADEAERQMAEAKATLQQALVVYEQAMNLAEAAAQRLAPLDKAIEKARDALRLATNRGGDRHSASVAQARLDKVRTRLRCAEEDAAQLEPAAAAAASPQVEA